MTTEENSSSPKNALTPETTSLLLAEYGALRDEIIKRIEIEHQLISLALIAPGTILAIGVQTREAALLLLYPILACFLSAVYAFNEYRIFEIGNYIRNRIEPRVGENNIGWETFRPSRGLFYSAVGVLGSGAIFIGTELLVLLTAILLDKFNNTDIILLVLAIVSTILSTIILSSTAIQRYLFLKKLK
jgi:hypothetical protein